jgi:hypothetical protein
VRLPALVLLAAAILAALTLPAAPPVVADERAILEVLSPSAEIPQEGPVLITARLVAADGQPVGGATLTFYVLTDVFGERLMTVGDAMTDGTGMATLVYRPTWQGEHRLVIRSGGTSHEPVQTAYRFDVEGSVPVHEDAPFGLEPVRQWLPVAAGVMILAVWAIMGLVAVRTVMGIPAAAGVPAPARPAPAPSPHRPLPRAAPVVPILAALGVLVIVGGSLGLLLSLPRGSEVNDRRPVVTAPSPGPPPTDEPAAPLPATLVRLVPAMLFNPDGELLPSSADLPAGIALVQGRAFILDSNRGRVLKVTPDGELAVIFESERGGETSIFAATAMAARGEELYIPSPDTGSVVVVSTSGRLERIIQPKIPPAPEPLRAAGIAVTDRGAIWLPDVANHRLLLLEDDGLFSAAIGQGVPSSGEYGFNSPRGLAMDRLGNLWVVDTLNGEVKKYSPLGTFVQSVGEGRLAAPRQVAVDGAGNILVSDSRLAAVLVFAPDGTYLGSMASATPPEGGPAVPLQEPHGLVWNDGLVYVMDRLAGLFVVRLEGGGGLPPQGHR